MSIAQSLETIETRILPHLAKVKQTGPQQWQASCPVHGGKSKPLGVGIGKDGSVVINCLAGCAKPDILNALDLTMADLYPKTETDRRRDNVVAMKPLARDAVITGGEIIPEAESSKEEWSNATEATADHAYLARKGVHPHGLRVHDGKLLVPMRTLSDEWRGLQRISPDGDKFFAKGSRPKGACHVLGDLSDGGPILIAEGFATAATLHEATGYPAVVAFNCGNLLPVAEALRAHHPDARIVVCADDDRRNAKNPGLNKGIAAAESIGGYLAVPLFEDGQQGTDFNDVAKVAGLEAVAGIVTDALKGEPVGAYPVSTMGKILGGAVRTFARVVKVPPEVAAASTLMAASTSVQHIADVSIDGRTYPLSLFFLTVAESGDRKSSADKVALKPLKEWTELAMEEHRDAMRTYERRCKAFEVAERKIKNKSGKRSVDEIAAELESLGPEPIEPPIPDTVYQNATIEGLQRGITNNRPSAAFSTDEAGTATAGHSMQKDTLPAAVSGLSKLWDGDGGVHRRVHDGRFDLSGTRVALHMMGTGVVVDSWMLNPVVAGQGILARMLISRPDSLAGTRLYDPSNAYATPEYRRYRERIFEGLNTPITGTIEAGQQRVDPRPLELTAEAKELWVSYFNHTETEQLPGGQYHSIRAVASKSAEQAARIAGVIGLIEDSNAKAVGIEAMKGGIALAHWYLTEALRLKAAAASKQKDRDVKTLAGWIADRGGIATKSDLLQYGPGKLRKAKVLNGVLARMQADGMLFRTVDENETYQLSQDSMEGAV